MHAEDSASVARLPPPPPTPVRISVCLPDPWPLAQLLPSGVVHTRGRSDPSPRLLLQPLGSMWGKLEDTGGTELQEFPRAPRGHGAGSRRPLTHRNADAGAAVFCKVLWVRVHCNVSFKLLSLLSSVWHITARSLLSAVMRGRGGHAWGLGENLEG